MKKNIAYAIIGDGRVARHFQHYFQLIGKPLQCWSRRKASKNPKLSHPVQALQSADVILLLIKDDAIEAFLRQWPELRKKTLVHFSGALTIRGVHGFHPLQTFGKKLYSLSQYQKIPFIVESRKFSSVFPFLPNPSFYIRSKDKARYHALIVMACSGTMLLWKKLFKEFESSMGVPAAAAYPILLQTAENLRHNPRLALSGPFSRRDLKTIRKNITALGSDPYVAIYKKFKTISFKEGEQNP